MLTGAIVTITLALMLYSVGVWAEKIQKILKPWHVVVFWAGFACDTVGTTMMSTISQVGSVFNLHAITGIVAILLMLFHAIWATVVLVKKREAMMHSFHKFSLLVWIIWLFPYLSGLFMGMGV